MVIKSRHPAYASERDRLEKLRELKRLSVQKLAALRAAQKPVR